MTTHYVYEEPDRTSLCQGDVLSRTPSLTELLKTIHPHYGQHLSYRYFLVLTQTCDLVRRNGKPQSAPYITLAAVRPVEEAIRREAKKHQNWWQEPEKVIDSQTFDELVLFTESLLDNNIPNYFYLHEDLALSISGQNCAFLALSVALRAEHYDLCLSAKIAQLRESFRAKLGWLVGNMYSRVGTSEWNEHYGTGNARKMASELLRDLFVNLPTDKVRGGEKDLMETKPLKEYSPQDILAYIKRKKMVPRSSQFTSRAKQVVADLPLIDSIGSTVIKAISDDKQLSSDLQALLRDEGAGEVEEVAVAAHRRLSDALRTILSDASFPNRDRLVNRIVAALREDTEIRTLLG